MTLTIVRAFIVVAVLAASISSRAAVTSTVDGVVEYQPVARFGGSERVARAPDEGGEKDGERRWRR
jgi:hypothetical protein